MYMTIIPQSFVLVLLSILVPLRKTAIRTCPSDTDYIAHVDVSVLYGLRPVCVDRDAS